MDMESSQHFIEDGRVIYGFSIFYSARFLLSPPEHYIMISIFNYLC